MFSLQKNLKLITINQDYLKYLHDFCNEVYYKPAGYETKPYMGILIQENNADGTFKHILSVIDLKKMIPIKSGLYSQINLNPSDNDSEHDKKYKVLLNIEYTFCLKIIDSIIQKASKLYDKQMKTKKIIPFCCDFRLLEEKCKEYELPQ